MNTNNNNSQKNIIKIKSDSIRLELLYRSLCILKKKFEKFKRDISSIYHKYYPEKNQSLEQDDFPIIKVVNFFPLVQEIFDKIKITIPRIHDINTIFNYDKSKFDKNSKEHLESIQLMEKSLFSHNKKELMKYNSKFYSKKIEPIVDYFNMKGNGNDLTEIKIMKEYDRKGRLINTFGKLLENNGIKSNFKSIMKNPKDEYDSNIEKGDILYIEILPIILADFLQENNDFVVINLDDEDLNLISDIKNRFDDNLLQKIDEDKNLNIFKSSNSYKNINKNSIEKINLPPDEQKRLCETKKYKLEKNIKFFQNLLLTKRKKGESDSYIMEFINKMEKEKERLEKEMKQLTLKINALILEEQKVERKKEKKIKNPEEKLQEIFLFYCSQHNYQSPSPTFDQIEFKGHHMNISEFCKFCKEFKIPLTMDKLMEIYNKRDPLLDKSEINFHEFIIILEKISVLMNKNKINKMKKKIEKINKKMKGLNVSIDSDEDINNNSDIKILSAKNEQYKKNIEQLKSLSNAQLFKELKIFLEIDKPSKKFKDKMKGFLFKYWDDNEKIKRYAPLARDEIQRVKNQVQLFKSMREKSEKENENKKKEIKKQLYNKKVEDFLINNKKLVKKINDNEKNSYILLKNLNARKKNENKDEFNLENVKYNTYEGIANSNLDLNKEEKQQIFIDEDEDNSDDEYFKKLKNNKNNNNKIEDKSKFEKNEVIINLKNNLNKPEEDYNFKKDKIEIKKLNNNFNDENNSVNTTNINDNLSGVNIETNAQHEIDELKMNLKPNKKENIYCSFNNTHSIKDITQETNKKIQEKKNEENNINNKESNTNNNLINRYQEMYQNTPRKTNNESKKDHVPLNIYFNNNINNNSNNKRPLGIFKNPNILKELSPLKNIDSNAKVNKLIQLGDSFDINQVRHKNNPFLLNNNKNRMNTYESNNNKNKIFIKINDFNYDYNNNELINKNKNYQDIKLPTLSGSNMNTFGNIKDSNRNTAHFKESQESNINNKINSQNNNNDVVLPNINSQRYLNKK